MNLYALWLLGSAQDTNPNIVVEVSSSCPCKPQEHVHGPSSIAIIQDSSLYQINLIDHYTITFFLNSRIFQLIFQLINLTYNNSSNLKSTSRIF